MRSLKYKPFLFCVVFLFGLMPGFSLGSETEQEEPEKAEQDPVVIKSKTLKVDNALKIVSFAGDVNAKQDNFLIDCEKMLVYYDNAGTNVTNANKDSGDIKVRINKIIATGHVTISRAKGGVATAEKAVYFLQDEKMILTGNPIVKQGNSFVQGDRIILFLRENRSVVESYEDSKVKAVIFPKHGKEDSM